MGGGEKVATGGPQNGSQHWVLKPDAPTAGSMGPGPGPLPDQPAPPSVPRAMPSFPCSGQLEEREDPVSPTTTWRVRLDGAQRQRQTETKRGT